MQTRTTDKNRVIIFDTTLRDGEQSPGYGMTKAQKLSMAHALAKLNVDVIEAGFAAASPGDFEAIQAIARDVSGPTICALARCNDKDIQAAGEALRPAKNRRIHVFIATSPIHREFKLQMTKEQVIEKAIAGIKLAKTYTQDVEFSAEDAIRTERDYLAEIVIAAIDAGATTINIPDTVGYTTPEEMAELFQYLKAHVPNFDKAVFSVHCHNDLGMAVANSLAAVRCGARQIECTINGIGERAGNASLEECVMALRTRKDSFHLDTAIDTKMIYPTSRLLNTLTGNTISKNKAIVGQNAFAHESGIHQHGMLKKKLTYEIMAPEDVGISKSNLVLGKHSGRAALIEKAKTLGFELSEQKIDSIFGDFKKLADKKKDIYDSDIEALIIGQDAMDIGPWKISSMQVTTGFGTESLPYAAIELSHSNGTCTREAATGDGPLDALFKAIERITGITAKLEDFSLKSVSEGEDAQAESSVRLAHNGKSYNGRGVDTDIVAAGALAYLDAINRAIRYANRTATYDAKSEDIKDKGKAVA